MLARIIVGNHGCLPTPSPTSIYTAFIRWTRTLEGPPQHRWTHCPAGGRSRVNYSLMVTKMEKYLLLI